MPSLSDFSQARVEVNEFVRSHEASIRHFWDDHDQMVFRNETDRNDKLADENRPARDPDEVHRITSTVTCLESLLEDSATGLESRIRSSEDSTATLDQFLTHALKHPEAWKSDEAAWVYCRVRALGAGLRLLNGGKAWNADQKQAAASLLEEAWSSRYDAGGSFGLRESTREPQSNSEIGSETSDRQYPANAFLTYWGLLAAALATSLPLDVDGPLKGRSQHAARRWLIENLATQVALHSAESPLADPQQLAWSICGLVRFDAGALGNTTSLEHELLNAGLSAFFEQQKSGTWPIGAPLFHYRSAGNAYAYVYETLAELLSLATSREVPRQAADALSAALREHSQELMQALTLAQLSGQALTTEGAVGWSSGHHPHRNTPESWATASVFRFAQALRRLVGNWSCADAKAALGARRPSGDLTTLRDRGGTWDLGTGTAGGFLSTAFVQPTLRVQEKQQHAARFLPDPDQRILEKDQARSAMLFGPPGTGKTTLVEAIAGALGWDFVEITPAQFLNTGVDNVSAQADMIFRQAMELDHCVILLDEIDELIQRRDDEAEPLERFFTTTMLPRLAKLWDNRRVLFFVNTNNISKVDPAIVRSQRFDAALLVLPPGYESKRALLAKHDFELSVPEKSINDALFKKVDASTNPQGIGWLALVRYDQMDALADALRKQSSGPTVTDADLVKAIGRLSKELARLDWARDKPQDKGAEPEVADTPNMSAEHAWERRDARMKMYARLSEAARPQAAEHLPGESIDDGFWVALGAPESPEKWAEERSGRLTPDGVLYFDEVTAEIGG